MSTLLKKYLAQESHLEINSLYKDTIKFCIFTQIERRKRNVYLSSLDQKRSSDSLY